MGATLSGGISSRGTHRGVGGAEFCCCGRVVCAGSNGICETRGVLELTSGISEVVEEAAAFRLTSVGAELVRITVWLGGTGGTDIAITGLLCEDVGVVAFPASALGRKQPAVAMKVEGDMVSASDMSVGDTSS